MGLKKLIRRHLVNQLPSQFQPPQSPQNSVVELRA